PGNYPPPPPGNFAPPPPGYAPVPSPLGQLPAEAYTPWITRVGAYLVDAAPIVVVMFLVAVVVGASGSAGTAAFLWLLAQLAVLGYGIWNFGYRQGVTGSSIGKSVLKFKVVAEATGQPIGFGMSIVRQLAHVVDGIILGIGYLFPLWDVKRQTLADKIMATVCLPLEPTNQPRPY
ncbi:RDD family protein, partial [Mycolicibacillus koreensis]